MTGRSVHDVLIRPVVSEKSVAQIERNNYTFAVRSSANKLEIKAAVELMFKVEVKSVSVANMRGKAKRFGQLLGRRNHWKKAYVRLKPGQEINFAEQVESK